MLRHLKHLASQFANFDKTGLTILTLGAGGDPLRVWTLLTRLYECTGRAIALPSASALALDSALAKCH